MILMALDHTRDFFSASGVNPRDLTDPSLFMTRWITHFCAPVFVFLAGTSAWFYRKRNRTTQELSRYLLVRGLILIVLEFTIVRIGWTFHLAPEFMLGQVIWVIGWSMIMLSLLVYLPDIVVGLLGVCMIMAHNMLDPVKAESFGQMAWLWHLLHEPAMLNPTPTTEFFAIYPLIPWVGVMAAGYGFGRIMAQYNRQTSIYVALGAGLTIAFIVLRATNVYGDPKPWEIQSSGLATVLAFIDCEKYPPSLLYLMMTLGPAIAIMPWLDQIKGIPKNVFLLFGRVPLFYYLVHVPVIHALSVILAYTTSPDIGWLFESFPPENKPPGFGMTLPGVYAVWVGIVVLLYPICLRFYHIKQKHRKSWLRYI